MRLLKRTVGWSCVFLVVALLCLGGCAPTIPAPAAEEEDKCEVTCKDKCGDVAGCPCSTCKNGKICQNEVCVVETADPCPEACAGQQCGDGGVEGCSCGVGVCAAPFACQAGECVCLAKCAGKPCGQDDGCGGVCACSNGVGCCAGTCCEFGHNCVDDVCVPPGGCGDGYCAPPDTKCNCPQDCQACLGCCDSSGDCMLGTTDMNCGHDSEVCDACAGGEVCIATSCKCKPEATQGCVGDAVYWFDSCGLQGTQIEVCLHGCDEQGGKCNPPPECSDTCSGCCTSSGVCEDHPSVEFCGIGGELCDECAQEGQVCEDGDCVCVTEDHQECLDGNIHMFDSCGHPEEVPDTICDHGCEDGPPPACSPPPCYLTCEGCCTLGGSCVFPVTEDNCGKDGQPCIPCDVQGMDCEDGQCICESGFMKKCFGNELCSIDSCGYKEEGTCEECTSGCIDDKCVIPTPCSDTCDTCCTAEGACLGANLMTDSACGTGGNQCAPCTGGKKCVTGSCQCVESSALGCHQGNVWKLNSCGEPGEESQICSNGCSNGICNPLECSQTCQGCCTGDGVCIGQTNAQACGASGTDCVVCKPWQVCNDFGICETPTAANEPCEVSDGPYCSHFEVSDCVCQHKPHCCTYKWDVSCVAQAEIQCNVDCSSSCMGNCGVINIAGQECSCDWQCNKFEDCCDDFCYVCPNTAPAQCTCEGYCGWYRYSCACDLASFFPENNKRPRCPDICDHCADDYQIQCNALGQ